jgi:hypothetical protein
MTIFVCASPKNCGWMQHRNDRWKPFDLLNFAVNLRDFEVGTQEKCAATAPKQTISLGFTVSNSASNQGRQA